MWNQHQAMASKMVGAGSNGLLFKMLSQVGTNQILSVQPMALSTLKGVWSNVILVGCKNIETADPSSVGAWQIDQLYYTSPHFSQVVILDTGRVRPPISFLMLFVLPEIHFILSKYSILE